MGCGGAKATNAEEPLKPSQVVPKLEGPAGDSTKTIESPTRTTDAWSEAEVGTASTVLPVGEAEGLEGAEPPVPPPKEAENVAGENELPVSKWAPPMEVEFLAHEDGQQSDPDNLAASSMVAEAMPPVGGEFRSNAAQPMVADPVMHEGPSLDLADAQAPDGVPAGWEDADLSSMPVERIVELVELEDAIFVERPMSCSTALSASSVGADDATSMEVVAQALTLPARDSESDILTEGNAEFVEDSEIWGIMTKAVWSCGFESVSDVAVDSRLESPVQEDADGVQGDQISGFVTEAFATAVSSTADGYSECLDGDGRVAPGSGLNTPAQEDAESDVFGGNQMLLFTTEVIAAATSRAALESDSEYGCETPTQDDGIVSDVAAQEAHCFCGILASEALVRTTAIARARVSAETYMEDLFQTVVEGSLSNSSFAVAVSSTSAAEPLRVEHAQRDIVSEACRTAALPEHSVSAVPDARLDHDEPSIAVDLRISTDVVAREVAITYCAQLTETVLAQDAAARQVGDTQSLAKDAAFAQGVAPTESVETTAALVQSKVDDLSEATVPKEMPNLDMQINGLELFDMSETKQAAVRTEIASQVSAVQCAVRTSQACVETSHFQIRLEQKAMRSGIADFGAGITELATRIETSLLEGGQKVRPGIKGPQCELASFGAELATLAARMECALKLQPTSVGEFHASPQAPKV